MRYERHLLTVKLTNLKVRLATLLKTKVCFDFIASSSLKRACHLKADSAIAEARENSNASSGVSVCRFKSQPYFAPSSGISIVCRADSRLTLKSTDNERRQTLPWLMNS